jgi:hypothetical protein
MSDFPSDAIDQIKSDCRLRMENGNYEPISTRGILYNLGFSTDEANDVLLRLFNGGFTYCLDPQYHKGSESRITEGVCYFSPDQLLSRIDSCYWRD